MESVPCVVVYPPGSDGGRRVRAGAHFLGMAYGLLDVVEFLREAGTDLARGPGGDDPVEEERSVAGSELIEWRGGGPDVWGPTPG
ncbi:hypothetical protein ACFWNK_05200 [Streptomyces sp. NPDC058417]|uniref:hypothetical protein n=1 Tax=unclassified Streptomyces TaxID=2593676 RepID=UPI003649A507